MLTSMAPAPSSWLLAPLLASSWWLFLVLSWSSQGGLLGALVCLGTACVIGIRARVATELLLPIALTVLTALWRTLA